MWFLCGLQTGIEKRILDMSVGACKGRCYGLSETLGLHKAHLVSHNRNVVYAPAKGDPVIRNVHGIAPEVHGFLCMVRETNRHRETPIVHLDVPFRSEGKGHNRCHLKGGGRNVGNGGNGEMEEWRNGGKPGTPLLLALLDFNFSRHTIETEMNSRRTRKNRVLRNTRGRFLAKQPRNAKGRYTFRVKRRH